MLAEVIREAAALGIPVPDHISPQVRVNRRAVARFGCCTSVNGEYVIEVSARLLPAPPQALRETLAHELLHTCHGCRNHGPRWKGYAGRMNQAYGYGIRRTGTWEEMGLPDQKPVKHLLVCRICGQEFPRARASRLIQHPERYRCKCGGPLERKY